MREVTTKPTPTSATSKSYSVCACQNFAGTFFIVLLIFRFANFQIFVSKTRLCKLKQDTRAVGKCTHTSVHTYFNTILHRCVYCVNTNKYIRAWIRCICACAKCFPWWFQIHPAFLPPVAGLLTTAAAALSPLH